MSDKNNNEALALENENKAAKQDKKHAKPNKDQKPNIFVRFWKKTKEIFSELKKVTWPPFSKVVKQTGIVIAVTLFFIITIGGFNALFNYLYVLAVGI